MYDTLLSKANDLKKVKDVLRESIRELSRESRGRKRFVREQFKDLANALLRRVAVDWYACFDKKDRVELFERIFVDINISPLPESMLALVAGLKRQIFGTERNEADRVSERKRLDVIETILKKAIQSSNLKALVRCLYQRACSWNIVEYKAMEGALMQVMVSLPERTRNAEGASSSTEPMIPNVRSYFSRVCVALFSELGSTNKSTTCLNVAARWISKLCIVGQSETVSSAWLEAFQQDLAPRELYRDLLMNIRGAPLEYLIREMLVKISTKSKQYREFISKHLFDFVLSKKCSASRTILSNRLLRGGGRWCVSCDTIRLAVDMLASSSLSSCDNGGFDKCFESCMESWSNTLFAKNSGFLAQRHIVVAVVRYLHHRRNKIGRSPHVTSVLKGIQLRLDSSRRRVRILSMIVATRFSESLNRDESKKPLIFDDCDFSVKEMAEMLEEKEEVVEMDVKVEEEEEEEEEKEEHKTDEKEKLVENDDDDDDDEEEEEDIDPDKPIQINETNKKNLTTLLEAELKRQIEEHEQEEDVDYDSDDSEASLQEYDTTDYNFDRNDLIDEIDSKPVLVPTFLRDCVHVLHKNENARLMGETLTKIPSLIESSRSDDVHTMATALLSAILHLDDKYALAGISKSCYNAAVKITVASPSRCVRVLLDETFGPERSVGDRIASLHIVEGAARSLSSFIDNTIRVEKEKKTQKQSTTSPLVGKSRRWGSGRREKAPSQPNRFAPLAGIFFFSLSSQFAKPFRTPRGVTSNVSMLTPGFEGFLIRYIETLGLLIRCARLSSSTPKMCSTMIKIALSLRYHKNVDVRLAVLHSIFCIIEACDVNNSVYDVIAQDVVELLVWIDLCAVGDSNIKCREESEAIREILRNCNSRLSRVENNKETLFSKIFSLSQHKITTL